MAQSYLEQAPSIYISVCLSVCLGAAPNEGSLQLLAARAPLVEIGAGTGYWARCLAERGTVITAYDLNPPAPESDVANAFHGLLPAFAEVKRGGAQGCIRHQARPLPVLPAAGRQDGAQLPAQI